MNQEFIYVASVVLAVLVLMLWGLGVFDEPGSERPTHRLVKLPSEADDSYVFPEPNYAQGVSSNGRTITPENHPLWGVGMAPGQRPTVAQLRGRLEAMRKDGSAAWPVSEGETIGDAIERHIADRVARGEL